MEFLRKDYEYVEETFLTTTVLSILLKSNLYGFLLFFDRFQLQQIFRAANSNSPDTSSSPEPKLVNGTNVY